MLLSLITLIIAYMIPVIFYRTLSGLDQYSPDMLDSSVTVEIQHPDGTAEHYSGHEFPAVSRGDILTASIPLPDNIPVKDPAFCFHVYGSVITLYCGDRVIYSYGRELADAGHMIGGIYTSAVLPADAAGKTLTLRCEVQENNAFSDLYNCTLLPASESAHACLLLHLSDFIFFMSISFFSTFAIILLLIFMIVSKDRRRYMQSILLAVLCNSLSGYLLAYYALFNVICSNVAVNANLEYIMLFLLPVPFTAYYYATAVKTVTKRVMLAQTIFFALVFIICTALNCLTSRWHYRTFVGAITVLMLISCILTSVLYLRHEKHDMTSLRDILNRYTQIILLYVVIIALISFNFHKYLRSEHMIFNSYVMPISFIYLMFMLICSFLIDLNDSYRRHIEDEKLERLAYTDCLTGLSNRSVFEKEMQKLRAHPDEPFALVYFDLNHLKTANDRYGHDMGDHYLCKAAELISASCPDASVCCRIGGDEFVTIFRKRACSGAERSLLKLKRLTEEINRSAIFPFDFSIAYGIVQSTAEAPVSPDEALKKADTEMYRRKRESRET